MAELQGKPSVLVLGTYHMGSRGNKDVYQLDSGDPKDSKRQKEIREVIDLLKEYRPTKIAVEYETIRGDILQEQFQKYLKNEIDLEDDEIHQLGFRLASELEHKTIYPVDWNRPVGGAALGHVYQLLEESQPDLYEKLKSAGEKENNQDQAAFQNATIREYLLMKNDPERQRKGHANYMKCAQAAHDDFYMGIDWVAGYWYRRNLIVYTNVSRLVQSPEDRILVIYGAGHKYLLDKFFTESMDYQVEAVENYLG